MIHKLGERISTYRKERHMSQEELAATLNVSRQTISKWETGDTLPDVYNAVALANLFHTSLDALVLGSGKSGTESNYIYQLKEQRRKRNIRAIIVGGTGSVLFVTSMILLDSFEVERQLTGIIMATVMLFLMLFWGYAIWNLIQVGRTSNEIKYLEELELTNLKYQTFNKKD
jgi:transcriptional regulator with XRE-family HTH domain